jgi:hypothetical protein
MPWGTALDACTNQQDYEDPLDKFCGENPAADECRCVVLLVSHFACSRLTRSRRWQCIRGLGSRLHQDSDCIHAAHCSRCTDHVRGTSCGACMPGGLLKFCCITSNCSGSVLGHCNIIIWPHAGVANALLLPLALPVGCCAHLL